MVLSYQRENGILDQISVDGLLIEDVELDEATVNTAIHIFIQHGLEGTVDIRVSQLHFRVNQFQTLDEPFGLDLIQLLADYLSDYW